jgi:transglutaminase-like putative cysteine protease
MRVRHSIPHNADIGLHKGLNIERKKDMEHGDGPSANTVSLHENRALDVYLRPTFTIESDHVQIIETAQEVIKGCRTNKEKAIRLFYYVRDMIYYNANMISVLQEDFKATRTLEWGQGYCVQKAVLLTALGRASGIPTRLTFAKIWNHKVPPHTSQRIGINVFPRHGYNQFFLNGRWINAAATFNKSLCDKINSPTVEFDGENDAVLPSKDLEGKTYMEYVEKFGHREDLPFQWIRDMVMQFVGADKRPAPIDIQTSYTKNEISSDPLKAKP